MNVYAYMMLSGSSQIAEEIFASSLAKRLKIKCPEIRLVEFTNEEWTHIKEALFRLSTDNLQVRKDLVRS